jgi:hypothetical protein
LAFEYLHQCHHSRREIVIVKLDFEKSFDLIEHQLVLDMRVPKVFLKNGLTGFLIFSAQQLPQFS